MGYMRHHTIVVTGSGDALTKAHTMARELAGPLTSDIVPAAVNGYGSFFVAPDGSKEGWDESDEHDDRRDLLIARFSELLYDDGSSPLDWMEIEFGGDGGEPMVTRF